MKNFITGFFLLFFFSGTFAQQNYFIYLQSENKLPFYIKMEKEVLSSSASGYLIIPKLIDGDYHLGVVFPRSGIPEMQVNCRINKADAGYLIKNFGDNGWGLANLQGQGVIMGTQNIVAPESPSKELMDDPFTNMLFTVVHDPAIREREEPDVNTVAVKTQEDKAQQEVPPSGRNDDKIQVDKPQGNQQVITITDSSQIFKALALSKVKRISKKKLKDGLEMIYVDVDGKIRDTIRIVLPGEQVEVKKPANEVKPSVEKVVETKAVNTKSAETKPVETKPVETKPVEIKQVEIKRVETKSVIRTGMVNSDCKNFAEADDVVKLKKKIAAESDIDEMIRLSKKTFKSKCFSTDQIRELGTLFLADEGRYQFFDAAYPWVSDTDNFPSLQNQLTEEYYLNRFKAMIHK